MPVIRAATPADAAVIAEFNTLLALQTEARQLDPGRVAAGVAALLADPGKGIYHLAEHEDRIVGQLLITHEWSDWRNGWFWWIQSVFVREGFRGRGVFRALCAHIRRQADERSDVCGLRLYVETDNHPARATYERAGMKRTSYQLYEMDFRGSHASTTAADGA
jgi:GNAT superfamily N-acetyltransferase